jgi:hypothetical protein
VNVTILQIIFLECPCAKCCRLRPPLDELTERLRREVRHGRDCEPAEPSVVTVDTPAGFYDSFQCN